MALPRPLAREVTRAGEHVAGWISTHAGWKRCHTHAICCCPCGSSTGQRWRRTRTHAVSPASPILPHRSAPLQESRNTPNTMRALYWTMDAVGAQCTTPGERRGVCSERNAGSGVASTGGESPLGPSQRPTAWGRLERAAPYSSKSDVKENGTVGAFNS